MTTPSNPSQSAVTGSSGTHPVSEGAADNAPPAIREALAKQLVNYADLSVIPPGVRSSMIESAAALRATPAAEGREALANDEAILHHFINNGVDGNRARQALKRLMDYNRADARCGVQIGGAAQPLRYPRRGIYIASKVKHADRWIAMRKDGAPIISTWIDEAGVGASADLDDLWRRSITEACLCAVLIVYREPGETLKGAWIEMGAALARGTPVFAVGLREYTVASYRDIRHFDTVEEAFSVATRHAPSLSSAHGAPTNEQFDADLVDDAPFSSTNRGGE